MSGWGTRTNASPRPRKGAQILIFLSLPFRLAHTSSKKNPLNLSIDKSSAEFTYSEWGSREGLIEAFFMSSVGTFTRLWHFCGRMFLYMRPYTLPPDVQQHRCCVQTCIQILRFCCILSHAHPPSYVSEIQFTPYLARPLGYHVSMFDRNSNIRTCVRTHTMSALSFYGTGCDKDTNHHLSH